MSVLIYAVDRPDVTPLEMPDRFRHEVSYFMAVGEAGVPDLPPGEYRIRSEDVVKWLDDGVFCLVSPLDSTKATELELTEDQERWLEWMQREGIQHIRLE